MKKFNIIFTGHFLKLWYVAFALLMVLMAFNIYKLRGVSQYRLVIYNDNAEIVSSGVVERGEMKALLPTLPVTKTFEPIK